MRWGTVMRTSLQLAFLGLAIIGGLAFTIGMALVPMVRRDQDKARADAEARAAQARKQEMPTP